MDYKFLLTAVRGCVLFCMLAACGQSTGCSGCDQGPGDFPAKDRIYNAAQLRVTQSGLQFLEENLEPVLAAVLPEDGLNICLPGEAGETIGIEYGYCFEEMCDEQGIGCNLNIAIERVDLAAEEPNRLTATIEFAELSARIPIQARPIAACAIAIDGSGFEVGLPLRLLTPEPERFFTFDLEQSLQYQLSDINVRLEGTGGVLGWVCDGLSLVINFPFIRDFIFDTIQGFIDGLLTEQIYGFVEDFTCRTCEDDFGCPTNLGASCVDGQCRLQSGECVAIKLGLDGQLDVGSLAEQVTPGLEAVVDYLAVVGSYAVVESGGISVGMVGGARSERNRCVPQTSQPEIEAPARTMLLSGNMDVLERDYHLGIGLTREFTEHFSWAFFNSGALCLQVTNQTVEQLNAGILSIVLPGLAELAGDPEAPIAITLAPQQVPEVIFGENRFEVDEEGTRTLVDPAIRILIPELWIDFHLFMDDRWARIFSLHTNVDVPLGLDFTPDNEIIPILGDLASGLTDLRTANAQLMRDDPSLLATLLPTLLNVFVGDLATGLLSPIALPDLLGFSLDLQERAITSIEDGGLLAIFARLRTTEEEQANLAVVDTRLEAAVFKETPTTEMFRAAGPDTYRKLELLVTADALDSRVEDSEHEYSWRLDGTTWSAFQPQSTFSVIHPLLLLQGRHELEVRARRVDDYRTLDPTPAIHEFVIDTEPPQLELTRVDGDVRIEVNDFVSPRGELRVEYKAHEQIWVDVDGDKFSFDPTVPVTVRATDKAGLTSTVTLESKQSSLIGRPAPGERNPGGGCECNQGPQNSNTALFMFLGLLMIRPRRKKAWLVSVLFLCIGTVFVGCDDTSGAGSDRDPDMGGVTELCSADAPCARPNTFCDNGICQLQPCSGDNDCSAFVCPDGDTPICDPRGLCSCEGFCPGGCAESEFCCLSDGECRALPDRCLELECGLGETKRIEFVNEGDPLMCGDEDWTCVCDSPPDAPLGVLGRYNSMTAVGDEVWLAAYSDTYGDLVVGRYADSGAIEWHWVDGIPAGAEPEFSVTGPRGGVVDRGADVGQYTALAASEDGAIHVAYYDVDNRALKYALGLPDAAGYEWQVITLDSEGDSGRWASISVDAEGRPGIAYRVANIEDASQVRYLQANTATPNELDDWSMPYVLHERSLPADVVDSGSYPEGTGLFTSQARTPDGRLYVAWYDRSTGQLYLVVQNEAGFQSAEVVAGWESSEIELQGDMGANADVNVDDSGRVYLCFQDGQTDSLRFLAPELGWSEWVDDGVWLDVGGRGHSVHVVGEDCNVEFDSSGRPLVLYQDSTMQALLMRRRNRMLNPEEATWGPRLSLRGDSDRFTGSHGFFISTRVIGNRLYVAHFVYRNHVDPPASGLEVLTVDL